MKEPTIQPCAHCGAPTPNVRFCSAVCRQNGLHGDWAVRRRVVQQERAAGRTFAEIGAKLGISSKRAAAIYSALIQGNQDAIA